jgi:hypothetical protein
MLLPLLIFVADQGFSALRAEGGKDKKKQEDTEAQAGPATQEALAAKTPPEPDPALARNMSDEELLLEIEAGLPQQREKFYLLNYGKDMVWGGTGGIDEALDEFLEKGLIGAMEELNPSALNLTASFGRCPSGYYYTLLTDQDGNPTLEGWMIMQQGCSDEPLGQFRFNQDISRCEAKVSDRLGYIPVRQYLRLLREAEA